MCNRIKAIYILLKFGTLLVLHLITIRCMSRIFTHFQSLFYSCCLNISKINLLRLSNNSSKFSPAILDAILGDIVESYVLYFLHIVPHIQLKILAKYVNELLSYRYLLQVYGLYLCRHLGRQHWS